MDIKFKNFYQKQSESRQKEIVDFLEKYQPVLSEGNYSNFKLHESPLTVKEALNTKDASVLMTKVIQGTMQQAAEPLYIGSKIFNTVNLDSGNRLVFPAIGALRAYVMSEGQEYRRETLDILKKERMTEVTVSKKGLMVPITEEMIEDSQWEVRKKIA